MPNHELFPNQEPQPPTLRLCGVCGSRVPADLLMCEICIRRVSKIAVDAFQDLPLRQVAAKGGYLKGRIIHQTRHLQMFGCEMTFCGQPITEGRPRFWVRYDPAKLTDVCERCRSEVQGIIDRQAA